MPLDLLTVILVQLGKHYSTIKPVFDSVSNYEIAVSICVGVSILAAITFAKDVRKSFISLFWALINKYVLTVIVTIILFTVGAVWTLRYYKLWDISLLKDTLIWFLSVGFFIYKLADIDNINFFKSTIKDTLKWTLIPAFFIHFFSFRLWLEITLVSLSLFFVLLGTAAKYKPEYKNAEKLSWKIVGMIGWCYIILTLIKIVTNYSEVFSIQSLKEILLPSVLTIGFIPVLYGLVLWVNYSSIFHSINYTTKDKSRKTKLKGEVFKSTYGKIDRVFRVRKGMDYFREHSIEDVRIYANPFDFDNIKIGQDWQALKRNFTGCKVETVTGRLSNDPEISEEL